MSPGILLPETKSTRSALVVLLLVVIIVHGLFMFAGFEISFPATVFNDAPENTNTTRPYAKRIVIVISDGLRADLFYNVTAPRPDTPKTFTRTIMEKKGVWGVSHARVPSMSRPGVTAITAGTREHYFSGLFKFFGISMKLDYVFNHAKQVIWAGEPRVPDYFGDAKKSWVLHTWNETDWGNASFSANYSLVDLWAFNMMETILNNQSEAKEVETEGAIFVVYLDATDASGHMWTPTCPKSIDAVKIIDRQLKRLTENFEKRFNDNATAFLFTADHGMNDYGTHGGGSDNETQVPFMLWGAGIVDQKTAKERDEWSEAKWNSSSLWRVDCLRRFDIWQIDLAPLISTLIGIQIPSDSKGILPYFVLNSHYSHIAHSLFVNYLQLSRHKEKIAARFRTGWINTLLRTKEVNKLEKGVEKLIESFWKSYNESNFEKSIKDGDHLVTNMSRAINVYSHYTGNLVSWITTVAMMGWSIVIFGFCFDSVVALQVTHTDLTKPSSQVHTTFYIAGGVVLSALMIVVMVTQHWPMRYSVYLLPAVWIWSAALMTIEKAFKYEWKRIDLVWVAMILFGVLTVIGVIKMTTATFFIMAVMHSWLLGTLVVMIRLKVKKMNIFAWVFITYALHVLIQYSVIGRPVDLELLQLGSIVWICIGIYYILVQNSLSLSESSVLACFFALVMFGSWNILRVGRKLMVYLGSSQFDNAVSWTLLALSIICPFALKIREKDRIFCYTCAFGTVFSLLTMRQESGSFGVYCVLLMLWYATQRQWRTVKNEKIWMFGATPTLIHRIRLGSELLVAYYVVFFIVGNIVYPTTFNIYWTRAFQNTWDENIVTFLIFIKLMIPFAFTYYMYHRNESETDMPQGEQVKWFLFFNSLVGIGFFYMVRASNRLEYVSFYLFRHVMAQIFSILVSTFLLLAIAIEAIRRKCSPPDIKESDEQVVEAVK